jgi:hypothetical protein
MKIQTTQEVLLEAIEEYLNRRGRSLYVKKPQSSENQTSPDETSTSEQPISDTKDRKS